MKAQIRQLERAPGHLHTRHIGHTSTPTPKPTHTSSFINRRVNNMIGQKKKNPYVAQLRTGVASAPQTETSAFSQIWPIFQITALKVARVNARRERELTDRLADTLSMEQRGDLSSNITEED